MTLATNLGFPRMGAARALKKLTESYWAKEIDGQALEKGAADIRAANWQRQKASGLDQIPSNDFSFYDQTLDMTCLFGAVPARFNHGGGTVDLDTCFAMARGRKDATAMEMTKWFDTNYHYVVPELTAGQAFTLSGDKPVREFKEALALGIHTRPVLIGPVTYLLRSKMTDGGDTLSLLDRLLPVYSQILTQLAEAGADWVQIDEPCLVTDLSPAAKTAYGKAYAELTKAAPSLKVLVATYFDTLGDNTELATSLPVAGLHIDLVRAPAQLEAVLAALPRDKTLSLGLVDGRNIWRADLARASVLLDKAIAARGVDKLMVAGSCSLLHTPLDLDTEHNLDPQLKSWLAFATQKLAEIVVLARGDKTAPAFAESAKIAADRKTSPRIHNEAVGQRLKGLTPAMADRAPQKQRLALQTAALSLPAFPTTTIGSFPQTKDVRGLRAAHKRGDIDDAGYEKALKTEITNAIRWQEEIGIDVLVHGEFERNDMVEYFGEQLAGFAFTQHGWVQSYGTRYVKPPIIFGDVSRPAPMTVAWSAYAQGLTDMPVKGMLTGPVTILQWSFVRDDQPRAITTRQIALAIRDEVVDLEKAGIRIIQIDEPALREGLPLRRADWKAYLDWAGEAFRLWAAGVRPETQIHTHMCYAEFNDIIEAIAALDADVISIETSRSHMELLEAFETFRYPSGIGPGVYDIHAPRIPDTGEMRRLLERAIMVLPPEQIWVNPDCGLKTRRWEEVRPALVNMVEAAKSFRKAAEKLEKAS